MSGDDNDFRAMSTRIVAHIFRVTNGEMMIIGVGGINNAKTAWEKITAGANALQLVTAIRGVGPTVAGRINRELVEKMAQQGFESLSDVRGINAHVKD